MTMNYDRWLEQPYYEHDSEDYEEQRDNLITEYMKQHINDLDISAMADSIDGMSVDNFNTISEHLHKKEFEQFGRKIYTMFLETLEYRAEQYAEDNIE